MQLWTSNPRLFLCFEGLVIIGLALSELLVVIAKFLFHLQHMSMHNIPIEVALQFMSTSEMLLIVLLQRIYFATYAMVPIIYQLGWLAYHNDKLIPHMLVKKN